MVDILFGPEVRLMLQEADSEGMKTFCETLHPATVADALAGEFEPEEVWRFLQHTSIKTQAAIFEYFPIDWQVQMVEGTGRQRMAKLIEEMSPDDRADLLRRLMPVVREQLLRLVDEADRRDIAALVKHEENSAGALMTTDYAWLPDSITAGEALDRLRLQAPNSETIYYVYILHEDRRLLGVLSLRDLILAPRHDLVRKIMEKDVVSVKVTDDREHVAKVMAQYDLIAIPVVDDRERLVGIVTHDDVIDVVVKEATEDVHRLGGVAPITENHLEAAFFIVWRKRVGWLSLLFVAGLFTIFALAQFQKALEEVLVLTLFIPLCIGTGGNSGSQAATLITRALALGHLTAADWFRVLRHELAMGLALGLSLGCIGFAICWLLPAPLLGDKVHWFSLSLVVSQAVTAICLWGTLVGSMLPLIFRAIGVDPAFASSPFVAMFVDVTGILIYFSIASIWIL
jgi:magnesium transporter